jgi:hypothetical protein
MTLLSAHHSLHQMIISVENDLRWITEVRGHHCAALYYRFEHHLDCHHLVRSTAGAGQNNDQFGLCFEITTSTALSVSFYRFLSSFAFHSMPVM